MVGLERERSCSGYRTRVWGRAAARSAIAFALVGCTSAREPQIVTEATTSVANRMPLSTIAGPVRRGPLEANAVVRRAIDGDTIDVVLLRDDGTPAPREERIRLIGIDTPETKRPDTPIECFGKKASAAIAALLPESAPVRLERDVEERDRYGRLLAYVFRASDGLFVNHELVRTGFAASSPYPPNVTYADMFRDAAGNAQAAGVGLWGTCGDAHVPA